MDYRLFFRYFPQDRDVIEQYHETLRSRLKPVQRILDVGCGSNAGLAVYRTPRREIWGVDCNPHPRLEHAAWFRELGPNGEIPFPDATFDLIASSWVLEHVRQPRTFLREVERVLRPGGEFVAVTVNGNHYVSWISRLARTLPHKVTQSVVHRLYGRPPHDTFPVYYRLNTEHEVRRTAARVGLGLTEVRRHANVDYFSFCPPLRRAAVLLDWALERVVPGMGKLYMTLTLEKPLATTLRFPATAAQRRRLRRVG